MGCVHPILFLHFFHIFNIFFCFKVWISVGWVPTMTSKECPFWFVRFNLELGLVFKIGTRIGFYFLLKNWTWNQVSETELESRCMFFWKKWKVTRFRVESSSSFQKNETLILIFVQFLYYYKMWMQFTSLSSMHQWIHCILTKLCS
jgi:hypothetical protein